MLNSCNVFNIYASRMIICFVKGTVLTSVGDLEEIYSYHRELQVREDHVT